MREKRLLACFAHPDDESFSSGGTLAQYASQGVKVSLICATRGEAGEIADPKLATPETLADVRTRELLCAANTLGISEPVLLGYRDSGMAGSPENEHPDAYINIPDDKVIREITAIIRKLQPQVILTFEPGGGYGHPDHIQISRQTTLAFHRAADQNWYPDSGKTWQTKRLFYTSIPRSFFLSLYRRLQEMGKDTGSLYRYSEQGSGWPDDQSDLIMDISENINSKWQAIHCHQTQLGSDNIFFRLPDEEMKARFSREHFALAEPSLPRPIKFSHLFDGL